MRVPRKEIVTRESIVQMIGLVVAAATVLVTVLAFVHLLTN